jgi:SAM-dependent methyltransferase
MCKIVVDAVHIATSQGFSGLFGRLTKPNAWRRLIYGWGQFRDRKPILGRKYCSGSGLEIGALHNPLPVAPGTRVTYVDRLDVQGLRAHYPELAGHEFVNVDIVDDGETLGAVAAGSQDFIIANHCIEHCQNPLGTIRTHLGKLKAGGLLFYTLPDRKMTFDWKRTNTPFEHLVADDAPGGAARSRETHYREWSQFVVGKEGAEIEATSRQLMAEKYSIHFHCWDKRALRAFLESARAYLDNSFSIVEFRANGPETVVVLKRDR